MSVRCAIYTCKSSEEGLEQSFNSLDAQREACAAYILSQASEGWVEVKTRYDDGGISGGTLERPGLKALMVDIAKGLIDIIVVYKVDRLTPSLLDFAKLVEAFDKAEVSFVSVTQAFNTTTSMGRLTLNMLLSFAQFEREVTAERIRDKIAASKAKGMWMGGIPPLGYRPDGRSLAIVQEYAALVRHIFARYLEVGNVRLLAQALDREGLHSPVRETATGKRIGGGAFTRGQLYLMFKCRTYLGEVQHKDSIYPGLHPAILDRNIWDQVQARLADNVRGKRSPTRARQASLLAGIVIDEAGVPLVSSHAVKDKRRYRYYVGKALHEKRADEGLRIPAREIEAAVAERLAQAFDDPLALLASARLPIESAGITTLDQRGRGLAARIRGMDCDIIRKLLVTVRVERDRIVLTCDTAVIAELLGSTPAEGTCSTMELISHVRLARTGLAMRLVREDGTAPAETSGQSLVKLIATAHRYWHVLRNEHIDITRLAEPEKVSNAWITRVLRLAFLSPEIVGAILKGKQKAGVDGGTLLAPGAISTLWSDQRQCFLLNQVLR